MIYCWRLGADTLIGAGTSSAWQSCAGAIHSSTSDHMPRLAQMREPHLVYEDVHTGRNLLSSDSWATPGVRPLYDSWVHHQLAQHWPTHAVADRPRQYVYAMGCFHNPSQWAQDPLSHLPPTVLRDAQQGRVLLIFDQSQEGNADTELWSWFYRTADRYAIDPQCVVYLTGDAQAEDSHISHCEINGINRSIHVLSTLFNLHITVHRLRSQGQEPRTHHGPRTALFNCLNRMPHEHRKWLFLMLREQGLVEHNLVSMPEFDSVQALPDGTRFDPRLWTGAQLPLRVDDVDLSENLFNNLNTDIYDRSWFTVITETYVDDGQMLIGEKVFKPMLCGSPFMILSSRHTLAKLRQLGFETFGLLWDESYDHMDVVPRMRAIVHEIKQLSRLNNPSEHFASALSVIAHNQQLAWQPWELSRDYQRIVAIWQDFVA